MKDKWFQCSGVTCKASVITLYKYHCIICASTYVGKMPQNRTAAPVMLVHSARFSSIRLLKIIIGCCKEMLSVYVSGVDQ